MHSFKHTTARKNALAAAVLMALGSPATHAVTSVYTWTGAFTMINPLGTPLDNTDSSFKNGRQTETTGTFNWDPDANSGAGAGTMEIDPFSFFGAGFAVAHDVIIDGIGDGHGFNGDTTGIPNGPGTLMGANLKFDWGGTININVDIVWDAGGFFTGTVDATTGVLTLGSGAIANPFEPICVFSYGTFGCITEINQGPVFLATVDGNPFAEESVDIISTNGTTLFSNLNRHTDGPSGIRMDNGPFPGFNANFDLWTMTRVSDGSVSLTVPDDIDVGIPETPVPPPPRNVTVDLGTAMDVVPPAAIVEYCLDGVTTCNSSNTWILDAGIPNNIDIPITQTVNTVIVDWRADDTFGGFAFGQQTASATVLDMTSPTIDTVPPNIAPNVDSTPTGVCFTGNSIGHLTASDVWDANPTIEWSLDGFFPGNPNDPVENCTGGFGPNENTVYWRVTDETGNSTSYEQTVTLNLPAGIVGTDCILDLTTAGDRDIVSRFIMRDSQGAQVGETDTTITGRMDPTLVCIDEDTCTLDSAAWETTQAFFGSTWIAAPVRLFGENVPAPSWTFEACPGNDGSTLCTFPTPLIMTSVAPDQLSAHMLFAWSGNTDIDVVVVWDIDCGEYMFTTTDPDGDGVIGTRMVDGPFKGFNAAFDIATADGEIPFADGGFTTTIPTYMNPIAGGSPPPLDNTELDAGDLANDPGALRGCVGGCNRFVDVPVSVDKGAYKQAYVVLPLRNGEDIPFWSRYRKFDGAKWQDFVIDGRNTVESAVLNADGSCPEPGSGDYAVALVNSQMKNKLELGHACIQLCIEDNGPNDADATVGVVADDSGVAQVAGPPKPKAETTGSSGGTGGCSLSSASVDPAKRADWTLMGGLLAVLGLFSLRRRRKQRQ